MNADMKVFFTPKQNIFTTLKNNLHVLQFGAVTDKNQQSVHIYTQFQ